MPDGIPEVCEARKAACARPELGTPAAFLLLVLGALVWPGCYYAQLAGRQLTLVNEQRPLPAAAAQESDPARAAMLALVPDLRTYARSTVQLPVGHSYSGYYRTEATGILFVVVGSERLRLAAYTWWFPVVGSVAYKAFTEESDARDEAKRLERAGYDAFIGRVTAYSSLGFFRDPVTSVMMRRGTAAFIEVLLHEMAHARLYVPGHTDFNEQLASFVGRVAAEQYLQRRCAGNEPLLAGLAAQRRQRERLEALIRDSLARLEALYSSGRPAADQMQQRQRIFDELEAQFALLYPGQDRDDLKVNNARLLQYRRYVTGLPEIERIWSEAAGSWPRFWQGVEAHAETL